VPPKNYGGTEYVIFQLVEEQIAQGHEVTLFAPGDARTSARQISFFPHSLRECEVPWNSHPKAFYHYYKAVEYLKDHSRDFDILHTHLSSASDLYLFPLTAHLRLPHLSTLHSQFPFDRNSGSDDCHNADHYYMQWISQVPMVAISERAKREEMAKASLNVIDVIHHGIHLKDFPSPIARPKDFFVWLGRLVPEKGAHLAIETAQKAGVRLVIAGIVDEHVPEAKRYFQEKIQPHLDNKQITFIGPVNAKRRNTLLQQARALLNPLLWEEPFGMVMIEAMATGCPVIAFPRGAVREIITSANIGLLANDVDGMVERIKQIDTIDRFKVRQHIETYFSSSSMTEKYIRVYKRVVAMKDSTLLTPLALTIPKTPPRSTTPRI
jgi:glycosyltransferase involved in cell wall biosynthesis